MKLFFWGCEEGASSSLWYKAGKCLRTIMQKCVTYIFFILISGLFAEERKEVFGVLKTVSYFRNKILMEISIQNNSTSTICLDSNLTPYKFQILKSTNFGPENDNGIKLYSGEERSENPWPFIFKSKMVKINPGQNHLFIISKRHNFGPLDGTATIQVKFDYYFKDSRGGKSIAVSKDTVFYKD